MPPVLSQSQQQTTDDASVAAANKANSTSGNGPQFINGKVDSTGATVAPLIVTSSDSRSTYGSNVNSLNKAVSSITPPTPIVPPGSTTVQQGGSSTTVKTDTTNQNQQPQNQNASPSTFTSTGKLPNGTPIQYDATSGKMTDPQGNQLSYDINQGWIDPKTGLPPTGQAPDVTGNGSSGSIDPAISKQFNDSINNANDILTQAKSNLASAQATVQNDPALNAALTSISAKYDVLLKSMKDKNSILLGRSGSAIGAFGGLGVMSQNFMSAEMDAANERLGNIVNNEQSALLKATQAYKSGDIKALNDAMTAYQKANNDKADIINKLSIATDKEVKNVQAQKKADQAQTEKTLKDIDTDAKAYSAGIAKELKGMSPEDSQNFISSVVKSYQQSKGLTDDQAQMFTMALRGYAATEQQKIDKADLSAENTKNTIDNRNKKTEQAQQKIDSAKNSSYKFKANSVTSLYAAGNTKDSISKLEQDIGKLGINTVLANGKMDDKTRKILESEFGVQSPQSASPKPTPSPKPAQDGGNL